MTQTAPADPAAEQATTTEPGRQRARGRLPNFLARAAPPAISVLAGMALIGWRGASYGSWIVDDAGITFAYARSFADGLGPVVQPGAAPVEGFSNPTWTALLALGKLLGLFDHGTWFGVPDYVLFPKGLALLCCGGILTLIHWAARRITRFPGLATMASAVVLAGIPSFVIWCFSGLENGLYALLVTGIATVVFRAVLDDELLRTRVAVITGVLAALAALTRPDGMIYAGAYPILVLVRLRRATLGLSARRVLFSLLAFAVPYGGYDLWRYAEFGHLLPNTSIAKSQGVPDATTLLRVSDLTTYLGAGAVLAAAIAIGMALTRCWWRNGLVALLVPLSLAVLGYTIIEPDWMAQFRFATPVWALLAPTGVFAIGAVFRSCRPRGRVLLALPTAVLVAVSGAGLWNQAIQFREKPTLSMCYVADRIGRTFNAYADILHLRHGSLLAPDLGGSSLTSRLHIVDMAGLVNAPVAGYINRGDMPGLRDYVFDDIKPDFIHSRGPWGAGNGISSDPRIQRDYYQIVTYPLQWGKPAGDWVRKDLVPNKATLKRLRDYANATVSVIDANQYVWPLRHCGNVLRPGQTRVNQTG